MKKTRVLIADDHEIVRRGVRALLDSQADFEVCGEVRNGLEAIEAAARLKPDLVVMDVGMPEMNGLEATRKILSDDAGVEVLILTMHKSEELVRNILGAGARGYVLKSDMGDQLLSAVRALAHHQIFITPKVEEVVLQGYLYGANEPDREHASKSPLTPREREIVQYLAEGKSNKDVAALLRVSVKTIETHRANLMNKLGLHSVSDMVRYAIRNKFIEP